MNFKLLIAILVGLIILLTGFLLCIYIYKKKEVKSAKVERRDADPWLFNNFHEKIYNAFFPYKNPDDVARKLFINPEKYYSACYLTGETPEIKKVIAHSLYAIVVLITGLLLSFMLTPFVMVPTLVLFLVLSLWDTQSLISKANNMKLRVASELPDFLDILKTELAVGIPIENAIPILCRKLPDSLLATELLKSLQDMQLGASTWQEALEKVANKYENEELNNFVMDVTTSYKKGTSVAGAVERQAQEIRQMYLLNVKERSAKMDSRILLPVTVLQILPLLAFLLYPTIMQVMEWL